MGTEPAFDYQFVTVEMMESLVAANLYHYNHDGDRAEPNYAYCKPDAPVYR